MCVASSFLAIFASSECPLCWCCVSYSALAQFSDLWLPSKLLLRFQACLLAFHSPELAMEILRDCFDFEVISTMLK